MNGRELESEIATDEHLLARYVDGDAAAFATLVERYSRELFPFLVRYTRESAMAEDVVQETFLQVHQSAATFDPTRRFRPWLFTIAVNKARDALRARTRKREVSLSISTGDGDETVSFLDFLADDSTAASARLEADELRSVVQAIVTEMPDHLREVLVLGYFHRFPYKDMAEALSIPLGTVKSRLHAAVAFFSAEYSKVASDGASPPR